MFRAPNCSFACVRSPPLYFFRLFRRMQRKNCLEAFFNVQIRILIRIMFTRAPNIFSPIPSLNKLKFMQLCCLVIKLHIWFQYQSQCMHSNSKCFSFLVQCSSIKWLSYIKLLSYSAKKTAWIRYVSLYNEIYDSNEDM